MPELTKQAQRYWLALARTPYFGHQTLQRCLQRFTSIEGLFCAHRKQLVELGLRSQTINALMLPSWSDVDRDVDWLAATGAQLIPFGNAYYPELLAQISSAPIVLFVQGQAGLLKSPQIAIVGSRNPSMRGRELGQEFAKQLTQAGLTVTSGLALGVDAAAHQGALAASGPTVAVAGTGLDRVYPARHRELAETIVQTGAYISEFVPGAGARAEHFPRRNRIISGLSYGVLVVEAALKSGSLITAHFAAEQGREVFAIPGSIHNPLSRGCHSLIRQGAKLVEGVEDIMEELKPFFNHSTVVKLSDKVEQAHKGLDNQAANLLGLVHVTATSVDELIQQTNLSPEVVTTLLVQLELEGYIAKDAMGYVRVK